MSDHEIDVRERLSRPMYSWADAARLAGLSRTTARRWLRGYSYHLAAPDSGGYVVVDRPAVATGEQAEPKAVSFVELIELAAIARLKAQGFSLQKVHLIVARCRDIFGVSHPLAELRFKVGGREAFVESDGNLVNLGLKRQQRQQAWDQVLAPFLETIDYEGDVARRWWPDGRESGVMVDPDYGFGIPVVAETGTRTEIIYELFLGGERSAEIADDFNLASEQIEAAIRFEAKRAQLTAA